eukprot:COSAG02_NODE_4823_length_4937_cov_4.146341_1_plen_94_part_00
MAVQAEGSAEAQRAVSERAACRGSSETLLWQTQLVGTDSRNSGLTVVLVLRAHRTQEHFVKIMRVLYLHNVYNMYVLLPTWSKNSGTPGFDVP